MELMLKLTLPANILDDFRVSCGETEIEKWIAKLNVYQDICDVAKKVFSQLCSASRVANL